MAGVGWHGREHLPVKAARTNGRDADQRFRREIYEPGDSRDVNLSIEKFLGRKRSLDPFLKKIGIQPK